MLPAGDLDNILVVDGVPVIDKSKLEQLLQKISKDSFRELLEGLLVDETYLMLLCLYGFDPRCTTDSHVIIVKSSYLLLRQRVDICWW